MRTDMRCRIIIIIIVVVVTVGIRFSHHGVLFLIVSVMMVGGLIIGMIVWTDDLLWLLL